MLLLFIWETVDFGLSKINAHFSFKNFEKKIIRISPSQAEIILQPCHNCIGNTEWYPQSKIRVGTICEYY